MERSQVKQDSLSLIEFKLQKRRLEVQLAVRGNVTCILNHISIPTYMLQGSKGQVTVNGSNQIQTSCGNLDHAHLGFDNTTNNQQQTTNHEPQSTTLGWTSPNSIWACNLRPLSTISRLDSLKSTLLLVLAAKLRGDSSHFGRRRGFIHNEDFLPFLPESWFFVENGCISNIRFLSFRMISPEPWYGRRVYVPCLLLLYKFWWFAKTHCHWHQIAQSFHSAETPDIQNVRKLQMRRYLVQSRSKLISFHTLK